MQTKKVVGALAISAALMGGGVAGAVLGVPGVSSAQTSQSTDSSEPATPDAPKPAEHKGGPNLDAAATALGITTDELKTELESGKTIAQVASDKGVDVQTVID